MAKYGKYTQKTTGTSYGKPFKKTTSGGKFRKGTMVQYKYLNGRRVSTVKASKSKR